MKSFWQLLAMFIWHSVQGSCVFEVRVLPKLFSLVRLMIGGNVNDIANVNGMYCLHKKY